MLRRLAKPFDQPRQTPREYPDYSFDGSGKELLSKKAMAIVLPLFLTLLGVACSSFRDESFLCTNETFRTARDVNQAAAS
jgi:hypothetical protein